MTLTAEEARSVVYEDSEEFKLIESKLVDSSRWSLHYEAFVEHIETGKFFRMPTYCIGATESQDERPYEYDKEVKLTEVVKKEVTVERWVTV